MLARLYRRWFVDHWVALNHEAAEERALHPGFDSRPMVVLIIAALVLTFQEYYGDRPFFERHFPPSEEPRYYALASFAWWAGSKVFGYLLIPIVVIKVLGGRLSDYGLRVRGIGKHLWIYAALFAAILPVIVAASYTAAFQRTYPFYKLAARSWTDYVAWELMYGSSFVALEFFFRGFLLSGLKRSLGAYAIFVMVVPYCMIHFHKPVPEVCGAIFAGAILGTLAMVTRSIWCGVLIHVSVAWTMDALSLAHQWGLPGSDRFVPPF
jgi:membrane protease YdiL (CAAX protease family)